MGSGVFLAVVVVMWFVVLVPMVLTRRDAAMEKAAGDNLSPSARILTRRTGSVSASRVSRRKSTMSLSESSPSLGTEQDSAEDRYDDEPETAEYFDEMVDTGVYERYVDETEEEDLHASDVQVVHDHERTDRAREKMLERRRRTLIVLTALIVISLALAVLASPWMWAPTAIFGAMGAGYMWHLRAEARREEERRLTRVARANRARRTTGFETQHSDGVRHSYAAGAFTAPERPEDDVVRLDDEDVAFYDLADAPVADNVVLRSDEYDDAADVSADAEYGYDNVPDWDIPKGA